jgi:hypothetical protein
MNNINYTLKLDFDGLEVDYSEQINRIKIVFHIIGFLRLNSVDVKQTKKGFHTYLYIQSPKVLLNPIDLAFLQSLMQSDYKRESFNFLRIKSGVGLFNNEWNVLFSEKRKTSDNQVLSAESDRPDLEKLFTGEK